MIGEVIERKRDDNGEQKQKQKQKKIEMIG